MKKVVSFLLMAAVALVVVGCSGDGGEDYDQNKIIEKQPGSGPPPLARPTGDNPAPPTNP